MGLLLNRKERTWFDATALEVLVLAGTEAPVLWKFFERIPVNNSVSGQVDCLYQDPVNGTKHYKPFDVLCHFEEKEESTEIGDEGLVERTDGRVTFVRKNLFNAKVPEDETGNHVQPGDIIQLWSDNKRYTWYFDIIRVARSGWQLDSDNWTTYVCEVTRNESFTPEQKIIK